MLFFPSSVLDSSGEARVPRADSLYDHAPSGYFPLVDDTISRYDEHALLEIDAWADVIRDHSQPVTHPKLIVAGDLKVSVFFRKVV